MNDNQNYFLGSNVFSDLRLGIKSSAPFASV